MTERTTPTDRIASARIARDPAATPAAAGAARRPRRGHAALGGRIVMAGLSASGALALTAAMAGATSGAAPAVAPLADAAPPATVVVQVVFADGRTVLNHVPVTAAAAAPPAAKAATTSKGS